MYRFVVVAAFACLASAIAVSAAQPSTATAAVIIEEVKPQAIVTVAVNKSQIIRTKHAIRQATVGNPDIAEINAFAPTQMMLTGKKGGSTSLTIFTDDGSVQLLDVEVQPAGEATTKAATARKVASRVESGDLPGFINLVLDNAIVHLNVDQIAAVIITPADDSVQRKARIVIAAHPAGALPAILEVPADVLPPHEVLKAIRFAKGRRD